MLALAIYLAITGRCTLVLCSPKALLKPVGAHSPYHVCRLNTWRVLHFWAPWDQNNGRDSAWQATVPRAGCRQQTETCPSEGRPEVFGKLLVIATGQIPHRATQSARKHVQKADVTNNVWLLAIFDEIIQEKDDFFKN